MRLCVKTKKGMQKTPKLYIGKLEKIHNFIVEDRGMTTPDSFFNIKPDYKPGTVNPDRERDTTPYDAPTKPNTPPRTNKDFQEVLEEQERKTGQPATLTKESKIAPRLGVEKSTAPSEEPRAEPYIEQAPVKEIKVAPSIFDLSKEKADDKLSGQKHPLIEAEIPAGIEEEVIPLSTKPTKMTPLPNPLAELAPQKPRLMEHLMDQQVTTFPKNTFISAKENLMPEGPLPIAEESLPIGEKPLPIGEKPLPIGEKPVPIAEEPLPMVKVPIEPRVEYDPLIQQQVVMKNAENPAILTKIATFFQPLLGKFLGEHVHVKEGVADPLEKKSSPTMGIMGEHKPGALEAGVIAQQGVVVPLQPSPHLDVEAQTAPPKDIDQIVTQIVDAITVSTTAEKTDTTITLKQPPVLEGAVLTVTSFKTAPNEINVTFANLTQEAKNLLDNIGNRSALDSALDQKGYTMHMITTTTLVDNRVATDGSNLSREKREGGEGRGGYGGQSQKRGNQG